MALWRQNPFSSQMMFKAISFRKGDGVLLILSILLKSFLEDHLMNKTGGDEKKKKGGNRRSSICFKMYVFQKDLYKTLDFLASSQFLLWVPIK